MNIINPFDTISHLGGKIASNGLSKLQEHFHLTSKNLQAFQAAVDTPRNRALVIGTASAVTFLAFHPMTRPAVFFFLGTAYSMTVISFNLVILGLSAALLLYKAGKAVAKGSVAVGGIVARNASDFVKGLKEGAKPAKQATPTAAAPNHLSSAAATTVPSLPAAVTASPVSIDEYTPSFNLAQGTDEVDNLVANLHTKSDVVVQGPVDKDDSEQDVFLDPSQWIPEEDSTHEGVLAPLPTASELAEAIGTPNPNMPMDADDLEEAYQSLMQQTSVDVTTQAATVVVKDAAGATVPPSTPKKSETDDEPFLTVKDFERLSKNGRLPTSTGSATEAVQKTSMGQRLKGYAGRAVNAVGGPQRVAKGVAVAAGVGLGVFAVYKAYQAIKKIREEGGISFEIDPDALPEVEEDDNYDLYM